MRVKIIFRWYDFWIGLFYDRKQRRLYIFPFPMIGILIKLAPQKKEKRYLSKENWVNELENPARRQERND